MTDRTTFPNAPEPAPGTPPDDLVQLYHAASTENGSPRGPSAEASARVLTYARQQAALRAASSVPPALTPAPDATTTFGAEPANDRRWLRHAFGSLAAIGLVGWLTLHHLDEPGAPQLDSPTPASVDEPTPTVSSAPATEPMAADTMASSTATANLEEKASPAPVPSVPSAIKSEAKSAERAIPPAASAPPVAASAGSGGGAAASASKAQQHAPARTPPMTDRQAAAASAPRVESAPARPSAAMPAPAAPAAVAPPPPQLERRARVKEAESFSDASADASMNASAVATERMAEAAPPVAAEHRAAKGIAKPLPYCDPTMPADAQAEQARRIKTREEAQSAGKPLPEPAPVCRPLQNPSSPQTVPMDSR